MRRGFITTLSVGLIALGGANAALAAAPSLSNIPVIVISDLENNQGSIDNNLFVFSDAFTFADFADDADTLAADLDWSFDYDPGATGSVGNIEINGVARLNGGDPLTPGALAINTSATATFREVDLSPTAGTAPFPAPAAGMDSVDTGVGIFDDVVGDLIVTYYVSDGADFDMTDSMVFTVDTDLGDAGPGDQAGAGGPPVLTFDPITPLTTAGGWVFTNGDNFVSLPTTSGETGGLQITQPQAAASGGNTYLFTYVGIWAHETLSEVSISGNQVYAARMDISTNIAPTLTDASKPRARLEPTNITSGIDYEYVINETDGASPFSPEGGNTYVAYWAKYGLSTDGQMTLGLDHNSTGSESGTDRTVTFSSVEIGVGDFDAFTGSSTPIASGTFAAGEFGSWSYVDLDGFGVFDVTPSAPLTFWSGGSSNTTGGLLTHIDEDTTVAMAENGGVAQWNIGENTGADLVEFMPGSFYWNQFELSFTEDATPDGDFPAVQIEARTANPAQQASSTLRANGDHADMTVASGSNGLYDLLWVAPDNGGAAGANGDDLIEGFNLFNVNMVPGHGGSVTLHAARYWVIGDSDPNNP